MNIVFFISIILPPEEESDLNSNSVLRNLKDSVIAFNSCLHFQSLRKALTMTTEKIKPFFVNALKRVY